MLSIKKRNSMSFETIINNITIQKNIGERLNLKPGDKIFLLKTEWISSND